ncbi:MAG: hypothetical protein DI623_06825 [Sphingomonas sanxanigenens]|uniref:Uncharacterized protein n=1 Tax=Sphingomonas sanxanigenens TaxID=397260 RepID=A0A2W5AB93_9SPHN|nr:MAG: hypothetical protein DI623_06825 [Sphingomonas sanxanigenens]
MANESEAMRHIRATLCARIDGIAAEIGHQNILRLCENVDLVRSTAEAHGLMPLAQLTRSLEAALAGGERGPMLLSYLDMMRAAASCDRSDRSAGESFAAAMSVRFAG